jgi:hypothetical protein
MGFVLERSVVAQMIRQVSISARDPAQVARALAYVVDGLFLASPANE